MGSNLEADDYHELKDVSSSESAAQRQTANMHGQLHHSLRTARLELGLERSKHSVEMVAKDEAMRKLRLSQLLMQDQVDELHEQLDEEQARSDGLEAALHEAQVSLDQHTADAELAQNQIRTQSREVANLKVRATVHVNPSFTLTLSCRPN